MECFLGTLNVFLSPSQVHLLLEVASGLSTQGGWCPHPLHAPLTPSPSPSEISNSFLELSYTLYIVSLIMSLVESRRERCMWGAGTGLLQIVKAWMQCFQNWALINEFNVLGTRFWFQNLCHSILELVWREFIEIVLLKKLSVLMLCAPAFIFTSGTANSSFRVPTLWFIDLTVPTVHIQDTFLSLCRFVFVFLWENGWNTKILSVCHFHIIRKWQPM